MHRGPAAYVLGPPPSRSRDLELEGGVIACHVEYVYESSSPKTPTCEVPSNGVQGCIQDFCQGSMSKRGGVRLFVAAGQPQGGGCRRGMCPLQHKIFTYLRSIYMNCDML